MTHGNLSIAHRMGLGFALLLLALLALFATVSHLHDRSDRMHARFTERIAPLGQRADALERAILYVGIAWRSYLLAPDEARLQAYRERVSEARGALQRLEDHARGVEGYEPVYAMKPAVVRFLDEADRVVRDDASMPRAAEAEARLGMLREEAAASARRYSRAQDERAEAALAEIAEAREQVSTHLLLAAIVAGIVFITLAYYTTQSIRRPTRELMNAATAMVAGDWKAALAALPPVEMSVSPRVAPPRNEMLQLSRAFGTAATALERRESRLRADNELAQAIASTLDRRMLADRALRRIAGYVGAEVAVMYRRNAATDVLEPMAGYGIDPASGELRVGDGLPGQAAKEARIVFARDIPSDSAFRVKLGYDAAAPRTVAAVPVAFGGEVLGVFVVASLRELDEQAAAFMNAAALALGVALHNVKAFEEIQRLLAELQERNETLQAQNEEIQAQNEEIQAQNEEIQAQHEEIQVQSDQLRAQNEDLMRHAAQMERQKALLEQADERKNEFLGFLAHELRNPMAAVVNSLDVMRFADAGSAEATRAYSIMERQARHLTRLIDDLLDTTRISRGKIRVERERVNLAEVVLECVTDHQPAVTTKGLTLDVDVPEDAVWVEGDRTRLCQVAGNLISNAVKFTPAGRRVGVGLRLDAGAAYAELRVTDEGIGIDEAMVPQLFKPFSQGAAGTGTDGGLGLGLALVKTLVDLHHGRIQVRSGGPGTGSEFVVRLPLADAPVLTVVPAGEPEKPRRILIIEDNADAAESLRTAAELRGHTVLVAFSGPDGLDALDDFGPDVVFCDIGLPGMDGYEVARRIRSSERHGGTALIALTGYASPDHLARAFDAGFDRHLAKPVGLEALSQTLAEAVAERRAGPAAKSCT